MSLQLLTSLHLSLGVFSSYGGLPSEMKICKTQNVHCSWASDTEFYKKEAENGIEQLGYVDDLNSELRSLRVFIAPIIKSTGINTKIFSGLRAGVPMVLTPIGKTICSDLYHVIMNR